MLVGSEAKQHSRLCTITYSLVWCDMQDVRKRIAVFSLAVVINFPGCRRFSKHVVENGHSHNRQHYTMFRIENDRYA